MLLKLINIVLFSANLYAIGGYDHGTSSGKGNLDISLTWNPFNYFKQGQSYVIIGYGLTKKMDIHAYFSSGHHGDNNYYGGLFYQFLNSKHLDLATAIGTRAYSKHSEIHIFFPQLLYTIQLTSKIRLGGSFVDIRDQTWLTSKKGTAIDIFIGQKLYDNNNILVDISVGLFSPVLWKSEFGKWYPTYSIDISFKR